MPRVHRLRNVAIRVTIVVIAYWFLFWRTVRSLTTAGDFLLWRPPFSHRWIRLPDWLWPGVLLTGLASLAALIVLWSAVAVTSWRQRRT